jgi:hypothetical protein
MKLNWGTGIALTYIVFAAVVIGIVLFTFTIDVNLVTDNYYEKEIAYQEQIDKLNNTKALEEQLIISNTEKSIYLKFPTDFKERTIGGVINFYRPSDKNLDFSVPISLNNFGEQIIVSQRLASGMWKVIVEWNADEVDYFNEKIIMVN